MPNDLDLDDRIRELVSAAVKTAPAPPDVDSVRSVARKRRSWPKWTAALAALLAAGGATVALQPADHGDVDTTQDPTPTTHFVPGDKSSVVVTAGPGGVRELVDGRTRVVTPEPMVFALALDDGSVVAQRHSGDSHGDPEGQWTNADALPLLFTPDGTSTTLLDDVALDGGVILHDFSVVAGRRLLLYGTEDRFARSFVEHLYTLDLDTRESAPVGNVGGPGGPASRLTMARSGLIVGTNYNLDSEDGLVALAVPGSPAAAKPLPQEADFWTGRRSVDSAYATGYVVDPEGTRLYWFLPKDTPLNDRGGATVMSAPLDDPKEATVVSTDSQFDDGTAYGVYALEIDPSDRGLVVNSGNRFAQTKPPVLISANSSTTLPDSYATVGWQG